MFGFQPYFVLQITGKTVAILICSNSAVACRLLCWLGFTGEPEFSLSYISDELVSQKVSFPLHIWATMNDPCWPCVLEGCLLVWPFGRCSGLPLVTAPLSACISSLNER